MSSSATLMDQTKAAIAALSNPSETNRANEWLVDFERSAAAWEVSDSLVREENGSYRFFGAKFLYSKVQKQFIQLDANSGNMLTQSLVQHILRISQDQSVEFNVCRYLCLALAALALQVNQSGILNQILQWLNPIISTNPNVLLELLIVLPEEAYNYQIDIPPNIRNGFIRQLTDSAGDVFSFLSSLWPSVSQAIQAKILTCASKWIDTTSVPSDMIVRSQVYLHILQSVESPNEEMFESAIDALIVVFQRFRCSDKRILDTAIPVILNMRGKWKMTVQSIGSSVGDDVDDDDRNTCRALCRLFTESSEACMDEFLTPTSTMAGQFDLVTQLLDCTRMNCDASISRIPLKFFYDLAMMVRLQADDDYQYSASSSNSALYETLGDGSNHNSDPNNIAAASENNRRELNTRYLPIFQCLLQIALGHLQLPVSVLQGSSSVSEELLDIRTEWKETVMDCCCVLGGQSCMELLCGHLQQLISSPGPTGVDWCQVETVLLAMQTAVPFLARDEAVLTPQVLSFAAQMPENLQRLRITVIELFGKYAFWLASNPAFVNNVLGRLFQDLQQKPTCAAAAKSIMHIFRTCSSLPGLPVQDLHQTVLLMRTQAAESGQQAVLSLDSELLLLEAITSVLSQMGPADCEAGFRMVLMPVVNSLTQALQSAVPGNTSSNAFTQHVDRITVLFQCLRTRGTFLAELFVGVLPLYQRLLDICPTEKVSEKCCRCYKHALRNIGRGFVPYLSLMTNHLADQFARLPYSAFVYGCSTCFSTFSLLDYGEHVDLLYEMLWKVSNTFFTALPSLEHFEQKPDVVEEYFFLMAKALQYCPAPFLKFQREAGLVVQAGLQGLELRHREAQKGILLFFERFVQLSTFWPDQTRGNSGAIGSTSTKTPSVSPLNVEARALVQQYAPLVLCKLCVILSGKIPAYALDESNGCISDVMWYMRKRYKDEFQGWLLESIPGLSDTAQQVARSQQIVPALVEAKSLREFSGILDRYELACRRNI